MAGGPVVLPVGVGASIVVAVIPRLPLLEVRYCESRLL